MHAPNQGVRGWKRGDFRPPQVPIKVKRKRYLVPLKMLREGESTNPRPGLKPSIFFSFFSVHFRSDSVDRRSKTSLRGQRSSPPPPFPGWMVLWDLATFAGLFNLIPTKWDRFDTEVIVLAQRKGGGGDDS